MITIDKFIEPGTERYFEYHCLESHQSSDAHLWYRSHNRVTVLDCRNIEFGDFSQTERFEGGMPLVYCVRFEDGFEGDVFEDELFISENSYHRPAPPAPLTLKGQTMATLTKIAERIAYAVAKLLCSLLVNVGKIVESVDRAAYTGARDAVDESLQ